MPRQKKKVCAPRKPFSGWVYRVRSIGPIAIAVGIHLRNAKNLLTRMPIIKTTNGSSVCAVKRPGITFAMMLLLSRLFMNNYIILQGHDESRLARWIGMRGGWTR